MHNDFRHGHGSGLGNGRRWLLIGLLVLAGFWLVNDAYGDGYRDALVQTGQAGNVRYYRGGPDFPWGLLILGGIGYIAWRKGAFDRFGGPPQGGERGVERYGAGPPMGGGFRSPRGVFEDWHRESHEAAQARFATSPAPAAPAAATPAGTGNGYQQSASVEAPATTPPPPPPAPEYWASMNPAVADAPAPQGVPPAPSTATAEGSISTTGPAPERW